MTFGYKVYVDMCFRFFKVLILQFVVGGGADATSLTGWPLFYTTGEPLVWKGKAESASLPSRPRFDAVCIPQHVHKENLRKQRPKKGYMQVCAIQTTLQSVHSPFRKIRSCLLSKASCN